MIQVSTEYFESINAPMRRQMNFTVGVGVANTEMANNSKYSDNGHMRYSNVNGLKNLYAINKVYTTAEANMYILDGLHEITPIKDNFQGYVSSMTSGEDSTFAIPPTITISSQGNYELIGLTLKFDEENNDYPTNFDIIYYNGNTAIRTVNVTDNKGTLYIDDVPTLNVSKIEIKFYKTHNYNRRIRVTGITLGIYQEFHGNAQENSIKTMSHITEISPLSKEIPQNDFSFSITDEKANYNAENPTGIWKYTKKGQIVTFKYIQTLNNGGTEDVVGGRFYLTDRPTTEDTDASFTTVSRIETLEQTYNEGKYYPNGRSFKSLFEDVFSFCGIDNSEYEIDANLANLTTMIPLPVESAKTCIQLLCQSCGKIAFEDTSGKIWIKDNNNTIDEYSLALGQNHNYPKYTEETAEVKDIIIKKYTTSVSESISEIAKSTFTLKGESDITISYDLSTNHTYDITGGKVLSGNFFGKCCKLKVQPNSTGEITIIISGNKVEETGTEIIYNVNSSGYDCELDFKMLSDNDMADSLFAMYKKYLLESKRYEIDYRGNPELRSNDIIQINTRFANEINAMILKSKFEWDNGASGSLTLKNFSS